MSLADMLSAYAEIIADALINDCDADIDETKFRVMRYHAHAVPEDVLCTKDGVLCVWWENIRPKNLGNAQCSAFPMVILHAKWYTCWKEATTNGNKMTYYYDQNDEDAARLAEIAECVSRRLMDTACAQVNSVSVESDPLAYAFLTLADKPRFLDCTPSGALGGAASLHWRIETGIFHVETGVVGEMLARTASDSLGTL